MFLDWANTNSLIKTIIAELASEVSNRHKQIGALSNNSHDININIIIPANFRKECAMAWLMITKFADETTPPRYDRPVNLLASFDKILGEPGHREARDAVDFFRIHTIGVIRDYFDEQIDQRNVKLYLLHKYKWRCEQFRRKRLQEIAKNGLEGEDGERGLCVDLYQFLHDQGLEFSREPALSAGWVDLLAKDVLIDAKFIKFTSDNKTIRSTVSSAIRQVRDYCAEAGQSVGYVLCFKESDACISIDGEEELGSFRFVNLGGFHIHYVEVDICDYQTSASHRGRARTVSIPLSKSI